MSYCYYHDSIKTFCQRPTDEILGKLASENRFELSIAQRDSWQSQIQLLKKEICGLMGHIIFEFTIPRMGKRRCYMSNSGHYIYFRV